MPLQFSLRTVGKKYSEVLKKPAEVQRAAAIGALEEIKEETLDLAKTNIRQAGNFGQRWTDGLKGEIVEVSPGVFELTYTHDVSYFMIHQKGGIIHGKPLLAIPLDFAQDAKGVLARNFSGGLFRVDRGGGKAPLLLSRTTKQPKYFLKESVRIPKRFRVLEIIEEVARKTGDAFLNLIRKS